MSAAPPTQPLGVLVTIEEMHAARASKTRVAGNSARDRQIRIDTSVRRIRDDIAQLRRLTDAESVRRFLEGQIATLDGASLQPD